MTETAKPKTRAPAAKAASAKPASSHSTVKAASPRARKSGSLLKIPKLGKLGKAAALTAGLASAGAAAFVWQHHKTPAKTAH